MASTTHTQHDHGAPDPESEAQMAYSLDRGHEQRDASLMPIVWFVVALTISIIVIQFAVGGIEWLLKYQNNLNDPRAISSVAMPTGQQLPPPEPRLQPS